MAPTSPDKTQQSTPTAQKRYFRNAAPKEKCPLTSGNGEPPSVRSLLINILGRDSFTLRSGINFPLEQQICSGGSVGGNGGSGGRGGGTGGGGGGGGGGGSCYARGLWPGGFGGLIDPLSRHDLGDTCPATLQAERALQRRAAPSCDRCTLLEEQMWDLTPESRRCMVVEGKSYTVDIEEATNLLLTKSRRRIGLQEQRVWTAGHYDSHSTKFPTFWAVKSTDEILEKVHTRVLQICIDWNE
ncbi:hypothetical protein FOCC_FOCC001106 [Frankliniella occidentalis]|nr:hypothetical protein FOCC_FOCC001106 [Frankliniella occidentalis]